MNQHPVRKLNRFSKQPIVLSLEEEAVALAEVQDEQIKTEMQNEVVDRISSIEQGIEDVDAITSTIDTISPEDTELVKIVGGMALSGTDADPEALLIDTQEGMQSSSQEAFQEIKKVIALEGGMIGDFFSKWFTFMGHWEIRVKELKERAKAISGKDTKKAEIKVNMGSHTDSFIKNSKYIPAAQLQSSFTELTKALNDCFVTMPQNAMAIAKTVEDGARTYQVKPDMGPQINGLANKLIPLATKYLSTINGKEQPYGKFNSGTTAVFSQHLLGGFRLFAVGTEGFYSAKDAVDVNVKNTGAEDYEFTKLEWLNAFSKVRISVREDQNFGNRGNKTLNMATPDHAFIDQSLKSLEALMGPFSEHRTGKLPKQMKEVYTSLSTAVKAVASKPSKDMDAYAEQYARTFSAFESSYLNWMKEPMSGLTNQVIQIVYAYLHLLDKSISAYE